MRILFHTSSTSHSRHFLDVILELNRRGHEIILSGLPRGTKETSFSLHKSLRGYKQIKPALSPRLRQDGWAPYVSSIRNLKGVLNYDLPDFSYAKELRQRAHMLLGDTSKLVDNEDAWHKIQSAINGACLSEGVDFSLPDKGDLNAVNKKNILNTLEELIPPDRHFLREIKKFKVDIAVFSPVVFPSSSYQADVIKAANELGIPTVFLPFSWDNLTNKGTISVQCDYNIVWNAVQKEELIKYHNVQSENISVCGAWRFDDFFKKTPACTKSEFLSKYGLKKAETIICYLCSSGWVSEDETAFINNWIKQLRSCSDSRLKEAAVIIRPHPMWLDPWVKEPLASFDNLSVIAKPTGKQSADEQGLFDILYYSDIAVGINTSAMIEAAILKRPVQAIIRDEFFRGQNGTIHFNYLLKAGGGLLHTSTNFDEHFSQMSLIVRDLMSASKCSSNFVSYFIRPNGIDRDVSPCVVDLLEKRSLTQKKAIKFNKEKIKASNQILRCVAGVFPAADMEKEKLLCKFYLDPYKAGNFDKFFGFLNSAGKFVTQEKDKKNKIFIQRLRKKIRKAVRFLLEIFSHFREEKRECSDMKIYKRSYVCNKDVASLDYGKKKIMIYASTKEERLWRVHCSQKEPWTVAWLEKELKEGNVFYDIGANVGAFSLIAASLIGENGKVISFEPAFMNFNRLCENIALNGFEKRIMPIPLPLASETKISTFVYRNLSAGQSRHVILDKEGDKCDNKKFHQQVLLITLDQLASLYKFPYPNHIKIDVDGFELSVLEGAKEVLSSSHVKTILIEIEKQYMHKAQGLLENLGYNLVSVEREGGMGEGKKPSYLVFEK